MCRWSKVNFLSLPLEMCGLQAWLLPHTRAGLIHTRWTLPAHLSDLAVLQFALRLFQLILLRMNCPVNNKGTLGGSDSDPQHLSDNRWLTLMLTSRPATIILIIFTVFIRRYEIYVPNAQHFTITFVLQITKLFPLPRRALMAIR